MTTIAWVFGYGSLIWDPGFQPVETVRARLDGYARRFCLRSTMYRGTPESPGLVLGLDADEGTSCSGVAMRIDAREHDRVIAHLRIRELSTQAYHETIVPLALEDGRHVQALAFVMRRDHWQYAGRMDRNEQAEIIARAHGGRGPNADYLFNTASHLSRIGLADAELEQLSDKVRKLMEAAGN